MKRFPKSILLFIFTGVIFVLQLNPISGVFLMMLAAPFWSVISINLGFVLMAWESLTAILPRWTIVFSVLYFLGYLFFAIFTHLEWTNIQNNARSNDQPVHVSFDPSKNSLVLSSNYFMGYGIWKFLKTYDLSVVYIDSADHHESYRLMRGASCQKSKMDGASVSDTDLGECVVGRPEEPSLPVEVSVSFPDPRPSAHHPIAFSLASKPLAYIITITDPNGQTYRIKSNSADDQERPLLWIPVPILGCALNDAGPSWECFAVFMRELGPVSVKSLPEIIEGDIAQALSLKKRSPLHLPEV